MMKPCCCIFFKFKFKKTTKQKKQIQFPEVLRCFFNPLLNQHTVGGRTRWNQFGMVWQTSQRALYRLVVVQHLEKKNTTKTFYFLLQRNVTSKTNALLHQPGAFLSGSFLFFFRYVGPDTCLELHILQTSVNVRPVSEVTPQNSGKEKKKHPSSETTMTFTQGWMEASPRPPTDMTNRQTDS